MTKETMTIIFFNYKNQEEKPTKTQQKISAVVSWKDIQQNIPIAQTRRHSTINLE